jgi:hypothetical protein
MSIETRPARLLVDGTWAFAIGDPVGLQLTYGAAKIQLKRYKYLYNQYISDLKLTGMGPVSIVCKVYKLGAVPNNVVF